MPDVAYASDNLQSVLQDLRARVARIESYPPGAMTFLEGTGNVANYFTPQAYTTVGIELYNGSGVYGYAGPFTLIRPTPLLVMATISGFGGIGGTATNVWTVASITQSNANGSPSALDVNGQPAGSATQWGPVSAGGTVLTNGSFVFAPTMPAGTYYAGLWYYFNTGAGTTFIWDSCVLDVFQLAG